MPSFFISKGGDIVKNLLAFILGWILAGLMYIIVPILTIAFIGLLFFLLMAL